MSQYIPLYHFFTLLRRHKDFDLGLEEYFSLIEVFQKDTSYLFEEEKLLNLCRFLWLKPGQSENLFINLFRQSLALSQANKEKGDLEKEKNEETPNEVEKEEQDNLNEQEEDKGNDVAEETDAETDGISNDNEDLYLNIIKKNLGQSVKTTTEEGLVAPYKIHLLDQHQVIKERQLKQRWRSLKKVVDGRKSNQIDIAATIKNITKKGVFLSPIYQHKKLNRVGLITLVDNQGSMIAFKGLTNALVQTAVKGAKIENTVFYYKNLPKLNEEETDFYVYRAPAHTTYSGLIKELQQHFYKQKDLAILLISDAGAARGNLSLDRLNATIQLLHVLKHFSFKIVWLNPVPANRWHATTASLIKDFVPMMEATEKGLKEAVEILRGKVAANSQLFYDELISN